jgi:hypothetical protein
MNPEPCTFTSDLRPYLPVTSMHPLTVYLHDEVKSRNPKPKTLNPEPETLNPKP